MDGFIGVATDVGEPCVKTLQCEICKQDKALKDFVKHRYVGEMYDIITMCLQCMDEVLNKKKIMSMQEALIKWLGRSMDEEGVINFEEEDDDEE